MKFALFNCLFYFLTFLAASGQSNSDDSLKTLLAKAQNDSGRAALLNQWSDRYRNQDFGKAVDYANQARILAEKAGNKQEFARALINAGVPLYYSGNYAQALDNFQQAQRTYETLNDKRGQATVLNEIGIFNKKQGDTTKARLNFEEAFLLSTEVNDSTQMANSMNHLGLIFEIQNQDKKALDFFIRSGQMKEQLHDLHGASYNYDNIGQSLTKQKRYAEAETWLRKAIDIRQKLGDNTGLAISVNNMGELYLAMGKTQDARVWFMRALSLSFQVDFKDLTQYVYSMISETWQKENNYKMAYEYFRKSTQVKDSIFNEQRSKQILDLEKRFETEKKEKEILILREQNELKDFRIRQNTSYIIGLVLLVPILLTLGFLWRNRTNLKQQAELEITRASLRENQLEAVISSQESERKRFAADLHDGLGQMISALRLSLSKENPAKDILDSALGLLSDMNVEIRNIAFNLMPQALVQSGLLEALQEFAGRVNRLGNVQIRITAFSPLLPMTADRKIALYRICQEWVNNAMKYSGCHSVSIELTQHPDEIVIMIEDDGDGFDTGKLVYGNGNGWKNISSRLAMMKGSIDVNSRVGHRGTTVAVSAPLS